MIDKLTLRRRLRSGPEMMDVGEARYTVKERDALIHDNERMMERETRLVNEALADEDRMQALDARAFEAERRLGATVEQNRSLRAWIRELRDTQEQRGLEAADPLYSMLLERIDPLIKADPAPESIDGARLLELVGLCEAYEKRKGEWPAVVETHSKNCAVQGCRKPVAHSNSRWCEFHTEQTL